MTQKRKHKVTTSAAPDATDCYVENWTSLKETWERMRWARMSAGFEKAKDAADSLGIKPGTYRTYERPTENEGRGPPLSEIQRIAKKFKVSWIWLASGEGVPMLDAAPPPEVARTWAELPEDKRDDALALWRALGRRTGTDG